MIVRAVYRRPVHDTHRQHELRGRRRCKKKGLQQPNGERGDARQHSVVRDEEEVTCSSSTGGVRDTDNRLAGRNRTISTVGK